MRIKSIAEARRRACKISDSLAEAGAASKVQPARMRGTGIGMSITANKLNGIRAAVCHDELTAEVARRHNNADVPCLPADLVGDALMLVARWGPAFGEQSASVVIRKAAPDSFVFLSSAISAPSAVRSAG